MIISFARYSDDETNLYLQNGVIKFIDQIKLENFLYAHSSLQGNVPRPLKSQFLVTADHREPHTRGASLTKLILPKVHSQDYGIYSIMYKATVYWNLIMGKISNFSHSDNFAAHAECYSCSIDLLPAKLSF